MMEVAKQIIAPDCVRNQTKVLDKITYFKDNDRAHSLKRHIDPCLLIAILKRKTHNIDSIVQNKKASSLPINQEALSEDLLNILEHAYGELLEKPMMLAMKLASSETTETTKNNEPTRLDVLHCLATHFDELVENAKQEGKPEPQLNDILKYGKQFKTAVPLHTFILGLPEHRKEEAAYLLNARIA